MPILANIDHSRINLCLYLLVFLGSQLFNMSKNNQKKRDYYQVLEVQKTAPLDQIKKAYKKMVMKWHPDKNPNDTENAKEKFRQVSEAYQVLSDPEKRKNYDTYGFEGPKMGGFSGFNFSDADSLFKRFFNTSGFDNQEEEDFFGSIFGRGKKNGMRGGFGFGSMFDDQFFKGGFNSGFSSSFESGMGPSFGMKKSVSTTTKTINGKTVTTKKTTVFKEDGTQQITQQTIEGDKKLKKTYSLGPAQSHGEKKSLKH